LLGHASVETTERYLGRKQNLGHSVNDLLDLGTTEQPDQTNFRSAVVKPSTPVEMAFCQGMECRHGGSEHNQPVGSSRQLSLPERTDLVDVRKAVACTAFYTVLKRELPGVVQEAKQMGSQINEPPDLQGFSRTLPDPSS
jgi:hypothetical protein